MSIYIVHRRRKTSNALDTLVHGEQECFQWTSERLVTTRRIRRSADSEFQVIGPATAKQHRLYRSLQVYMSWLSLENRIASSLCW